MKFNLLEMKLMDNERVLVLYEEGRTLEQIAEAMETAPSEVTALLVRDTLSV